MNRTDERPDASAPQSRDNEPGETLTPFEANIDFETTDVQRVSERTNIHDAGSDANDTEDGLTESEEAVRQAAEDIPIGGNPAAPRDSIPVFDRGSLPPEV